MTSWSRSSRNCFAQSREVRRTHAVCLGQPKRLRTSSAPCEFCVFSQIDRRLQLILGHQLLAALSEVQTQWAASIFSGTYSDAKEHSAALIMYKQTIKRTWVVEKQDVATLFGNVQTKLRTYGLREYVPSSGLALSDLDEAWQELLKSEARRSRAINAEIRQ